MEKQVLPGLRNTFLAHAIVGVIFGLVFLLAAGWYASLTGGSAQEEGLYRILGAAVLAFGASSWWAFHENEWSRVRILTEMEIVWTTLGALATAWGILANGLSPIAWLNAILLALFAAAFGYFYVQESAAVSRPQPR